jgi:hypothetical protein
MNFLSVFLFVHSASYDEASLADARRLQALKTLREELQRLDVRVSALPQEADLRVEIAQLLGVDNGPTVRSGTYAVHLIERPRTLVVRVSAGDEQFDLVCVDGLSNTTAEWQAARRIHARLSSQMSAPTPQPAHPRDFAWAG